MTQDKTPAFTFELDDQEMEKFCAWAENQGQPVPGRYTFSFTITATGTKTKVRDNIKNEELDLSE